MVKKSVSDDIAYFLKEDVGSGDVTSSFTPDKKVVAVIKSNSSGILAGAEEVTSLLRKQGVKVVFHVKDGSNVSAGSNIATIEGPVRSILPVERTVLNILSRMSGVATLTRTYVGLVYEVSSTVRIAATRKTSPGFRYFDKKAVVVGGGVSHRMGLYDMVLIKDNHLFVFEGDIGAAVAASRKKNRKMKVEVEVSTTEEALTAARSGADMILLDNMTPSTVRETVNSLVAYSLRDKVLLEASGGVRLSNVREYAKTGVDWISLGELTRSPIGLDFSLDFIQIK